MKAKEKQDLGVKLVCGACGKPVSDKSTGGLTRWLTQGSFCSCAQPQVDAGNRTVAGAPETAAPEGMVKSPILDVLDERYEVLALLGKGGMGAVYKVRNKYLNKVFAVKVLNPQLVGDATSLKRFKQEAQAASRLTHANLVAVYDFGTGKTGAPFLIMDYLDGNGLDDVLKKEGFLEPARALDLFIQICEGVSHAHAKGVVHRDLKPSNVIITSKDGVEIVKIVDFGIAKILPNEGKVTQDLTQEGEIFGSPFYMSPEQCQGLKLDARSDIYALGCVLYEALTGKPPIAGANPLQTLLMHLSTKPTPFSELDHDYGVPAALESVVMHCLEKDPDDRYQSINDLLKDLTNIREGLPAKLKKKARKSKAWARTGKIVWALSAVMAVLMVSMWIVPGFVSQAPAPAISGDPYKDAERLDQLSYHYFSTGDYERAIPLLEFGIKTYMENGSKLGRGGEDQYLADNYQHIGKCYLKLKQPDKAAPYYQKALAIYKKFGNYRGTMFGEAVEDYASVLKQLGRGSEAETMQKEFQTLNNLKTIP